MVRLFPLSPRGSRTYVVALVVLLLVWRLWVRSSLMIDTAPADAAARQVCGEYGWETFVAKPSSSATPRPRRVYDLCMVSDELDWLEIRLNTTYDDVDYFVLVEAPLTFTGLPKPLTIRDHWARFAPYHAKMLYRTLTYPPGFAPARAWDREDLQRNALLGVLEDDASYNEEVEVPEAVPKAGPSPFFPAAARPAAGDVLVVADADEIPRPAALRVLRQCRFPLRLTLESHFYYYSFQFRHRGPDWPHPQATEYRPSSFFGGRLFRLGTTVSPVNLRNGDGNSASGLLNLLTAPARRRQTGALPAAAWHCSSCYATMAALLHKLESVSHTWMNDPVFRQRDRAADHVRAGRDLWDRASEIYDRVDGNADVPPPLLTAQQQLGDQSPFRYLLSRDGPTAGFSDYPP